MSQLREGDIFLFSENSGGNMQVVNGEPLMDGGFESAVYLSLFGNDSSEWWANEYLEQSQQLSGAFIGFILSEAKSIANLNRSQKFALADLQWFKDEGIADIITAEVVSVDRQRIELTIELFANAETIFKNTFEVNWGFQLNAPASGSVIVPAEQFITLERDISDGRLRKISDGTIRGAQTTI